MTSLFSPIALSLDKLSVATTLRHDRRPCLRIVRFDERAQALRTLQVRDLPASTLEAAQAMMSLPGHNPADSHFVHGYFIATSRHARSWYHRWSPCREQGVQRSRAADCGLLQASCAQYPACAACLQIVVLDHYPRDEVTAASLPLRWPW